MALTLRCAALSPLVVMEAALGEDKAELTVTVTCAVIALIRLHWHAGQYRQVVVEVALGGDGYRVVRQCELDFNLSGGDSGLAAIRFQLGPHGGTFGAQGHVGVSHLLELE